MDTRKKLREANYFMGELLGELGKRGQTPEPFDFYMSAFLHAWRGVLDVMLYDFAEHFSLGFSREDELNIDNFKKAAESKKCADGIEFSDWWLDKQKMLRNNPLWSKRNITTHRGYVGMIEHVYYLSGSGATSSSVSYYFAQADASDVSKGTIPVSTHAVIQPDFASKQLGFVGISGDAIAVCRNALSDMERIVEEAERAFKVSL